MPPAIRTAPRNLHWATGPALSAICAATGIAWGCSYLSSASVLTDEAVFHAHTWGALYLAAGGALAAATTAQIATWWATGHTPRHTTLALLGAHIFAALVCASSTAAITTGVLDTGSGTRIAAAAAAGTLLNLIRIATVPADLRPPWRWYTRG